MLSKKDIIIFLLIGVIIFTNFKQNKKIEKMSNIDTIKTVVNKLYKADVQSIRNLAEISQKLQKGTLTIPGNLTVKGNIKCGPNLIKNNGEIHGINIHATKSLNSKNIFNLNYNFITKAIYKSILIKKEYVLRDEKEKLKNQHSRAILNFGHTFGHALETYYKYNSKLTHGEAISIGMIIASTISYKLNYLSYKSFNKIKNHFRSNNLPIIDAKMYDKKIFKIIYNDKKNINGKINFVLLKNIGNAFLKQSISLEKIKKIIK